MEELLIVRLLTVTCTCFSTETGHLVLLHDDMSKLFSIFIIMICVLGDHFFWYLFKLGVFCCNVATMVSLCSLNELVISCQVLKKLALFAVLLRRIFF